MKKNFKYLNLSEIAKNLSITSSNVSSRPSYNTLAILEACNHMVSIIFGDNEYKEYSFVYNKKIVGRISWDKKNLEFNGYILNTDYTFKGKNLPELHRNFVELVENEFICQQ